MKGKKTGGEIKSASEHLKEMTLFMELGSGTLTRIIIGIIKSFYPLLLEKISTVLLKIMIIHQETSSGVGNRSEIAFLGMTFIFFPVS